MSVRIVMCFLLLVAFSLAFLAMKQYTKVKVTLTVPQKGLKDCTTRHKCQLWNGTNNSRVRSFPPKIRRVFSNSKNSKAKEACNQLNYYSSIDFLLERNPLQLPANLRQYAPIDGAKILLLRQLFFAATALLKRLNVQYILIYGSLIGSYRHHNLIPWDDDIDVLVDHKYKGTLENAFASGTIIINDMKLELKIFGENNWKIHLVREHAVLNGIANPLWPFLDIFPYIDNGTYLCLPNLPWPDLPKHTVYPLQMRPFEGSLQPVPYDIEHNLKAVYGPEFDKTCTPTSFIHVNRTEVASTGSIRCNQLYKYYPFVKRAKAPDRDIMIETLTLNNKFLGNYSFPLPTRRSNSN